MVPPNSISFSSLWISAEAMFLQQFDIASHEGELVGTQMIKVIPCVYASLVQVIKNYSGNHPQVNT